jgi:hypothetical protein
MGELIPLTELSLSLPVPATGWAAELDRRGILIEPDDIGRPAISRAAARDLLSEHREDEARKARKREEIERQAVEADKAFRASLPGGVSAATIPEGVTAAELLMLSDPMQGAQRESVLEHALANPDGAIVYHPLNENAS